VRAPAQCTRRAGASPNAYTTHRDAGILGVTGNNDKDASFELFSPPYLFRGPRPRILYAPAAIAWGSTFGIRTDTNAADIESVALMRLPALTHVVDGNQRTLLLHKEATGNGLALTAPPDGVAAPPGPYYLVINKRTPKGVVPSVARIVTIGDHASAAAAPAPMPDRASSGGGASAPDDTSILAGSASVPVADLRRVLRAY
jgi:hypothetical protein